METQNNSEGQNEVQAQQIENSSDDNSLSPKLKKEYRKFIFWFLAIVVIAAIGYPIGKGLYGDYIQKKNINLLLMENNVYGGKTPQETYDLFLTALEKGNSFEAAKYFFDKNDRETFYIAFVQLEKTDKMDYFLKTIPLRNEMREVDTDISGTARFIYNFEWDKDINFDLGNGQINFNIPTGPKEGVITFRLNQETNIWQISIIGRYKSLSI